jgi:acyl-CoA synthetase (AMP-forming)/AMP-acid ligase II
VTPADLLARELRRDGARPLLTWYDDATGGRVELSVATTANWAAKIANFLVDEHGVEPGDEVGIDPRLHWITGVVLLGAWTAGAHAVIGGAPAVDPAYDAMGAGLSALVAAQPDQVVMPVQVADEPALTVGGRTWSHTALAAAAAHGAQQHQLDATCRVLSTMSFDTAVGLDAGLLVPLAAGGSVVLVTAADDARLVEHLAAERATHVTRDGHLAQVRVAG